MRSLIAAVLVFAVCTTVASARTWTDSTGKYTVEAEFVDLKDGKVRLKKEDGKPITIPLERLSDADQEFVKTQGHPGPARDENRPAKYAFNDAQYEARVAEAIKLVNGMNPETGWDNAMKGLSLLSKEAIRRFDTLNPSLEDQERINAITNCATLFRLGDYTYAQVGDKGNENADEKAFLAALNNIKEDKVKMVMELTTPAQTPPSKIAVVTLLAISQGRYVREQGKVNTSAFDAAMENLSVARIGKVASCFKAASYFDDRLKACGTLLFGSARFVKNDGSLDVDNLNARLDAITPERVETVKKQLRDPDSAEAFTVLFRP